MAEDVVKTEISKIRKPSASLVTDVLLKSGCLEKEDINACVKKTLQKAEEVKVEVLQVIYKEYTFDEFVDFSNSTFEMNWKVNNLLSEIQNVSGKVKGSVEGSLEAAAREHSELVKQLKEADAIAELLERLYKKELLSNLPKAGQEGKIFLSLRDECCILFCWYIAFITQVEVLQVIYKEYTFDEFVDFSNSTFEMNWKVNNLLSEIQNVSGKVKGSVEGSLEAAAREHSELVKQLKEADAIAELLERLYKIHEALDAFPAEMNKEDYSKAANLVHDVKELLSNLPKAGQEGKIFLSLQDEWHRQKAQLTATLERIWARSVAWTTPAAASLDNRQGHLNTQLKLNTGEQDLLLFIWILGIVEKLLHSFGKKVVQYIFRPLIVFPSLKPEISVKNQEIVLSFVKEGRKKVIDPGPLYLKFCEIFTVLGTFFDGTSIKDENFKSNDINVKSAALFAKLGEFVWPVLSENIINECLKRSVPTTSAQLERYEDVVKNTEEFEAKLVSLGFIPEGTSDLTSYVKDVGIHFGNKKCQDLLVVARDLMKDDIHNTVQVDSNTDKAVLVNLGEVEKTLQGKKGTKFVPLQRDEGTTVSKFTFCLPACRISESTEKLMTLAYKTLFEAVQSTPTWKIQQSNLLELVKNTQGFANVHEEAKNLQVEKTMKQILHLLTNLGKVWKGILPINIYCQSLGALFDDVIQYIAWEVLQLEDISADEADHLPSLLSILVQRGSEIFQTTPETDSSSDGSVWDVCTVVPHWTRYKELIGILKASLQEIGDRWTDGKGPLAQEFTAQEVRGLIRAIFQNTDRRAAILAKIKAV
ncbi:PREDICTED: centromere/kinetochore protein zw10 homolog [Acropora digitifera]|uniref:centromere/kinetochore protein zw10 homolog n=1 Tax=Acropora digitifera TaxID=70779 RepID=UPI00077AB388|nr:PREDICTED: centromere/kinetochore protein zw10 homolog [Acropora digitifera]